MKKGFTVIEVALVIAVAGLIFLAVFAALPALQASGRDTVRKDDITKVISAISKYSANHRGTLANNSTAISVIQQDYLDGDNFSDPSGNPYILSAIDLDASNTPFTVENFDNTIHIVYHSKCDGETAIYTSDKRDYSILYRLEGSGTYCINVDI